MSYRSTDVVLAVVNGEHAARIEAWRNDELPSFNLPSATLSPPLGGSHGRDLYVMSKVELRYSEPDSSFSLACAAFIRLVKDLAKQDSLERRGRYGITALAYDDDVGPPLVTYYRRFQEYGDPEAPFDEALDMPSVREAERC